MNILAKITALLLVLACIFISCEKKVQIPANKIVDTDSTSAEFIKLNKLLVEVESSEIKKYIEQTTFAFDSTEIGVWYAITNKSNGTKIRKGDILHLQYNVELLNGDTCYSYVDKRAQEMTVGKTQYERGLHEALTSLHEGDQAIVIAPSHLSFGTLGDRNKVPPRAALVYRIISSTIVSE